MIKRTLYFGNPAYLSLRNNQLVIQLPEVVKNDTVPESFKKDAVKTIPVEDIGVVVLDDKQITVTQGLLEALLKNNCALITCDSSHMPLGLVLPLEGHNIQQQRFAKQIAASLPLKKQLWQQTVIQKITNQAALLEKLGRNPDRVLMWAERVKSGDSSNCEGRASYNYWELLFHESMNFSRKRDGDPPNNLLNYGYAILRAITARCLTGSGLLPTLGIHHRNKYNAYCLADDIMEPYRPFVDELVCRLVAEKGVDVDLDLSKEVKSRLLGIAGVDVRFGDERSPLSVGMQRTTSSLARCFEGEIRKIAYPELN